MYILSIEPSYPEAYWFQYENEEPSMLDMISCKEVGADNLMTFRLAGKVSENNVLRYDFLYSGNGPNIISPRLATVLENDIETKKCIQLIDATIIINKKVFLGYKVLNILHEISCIDVERSLSRPLLSSRPDGPLHFENIVFKKITNNSIPIFRAAESSSKIIVTKHFKRLCKENNVKGFVLEEGGI